MGKFISNFQTTAEFTNFSATTACGIPHLSLTKDDGKIHMIKDLFNGHDYVEIGGLKWATKNVGASSITDTGLYFQWGDTQGYTASQVGSGSGQKYFGWADYKYGNGTDNPDATGMTKYNSTDNLITLKIPDDAARANMGGKWRIPSASEWEALVNAITSTWTDDYEGSGVAGRIYTDNTDSSKKLFFPAAGAYNNGDFYYEDFGLYWNNSISTANYNIVTARILLLGSNAHRPYIFQRSYGLPIRGVVG